jgi:hypothetical protein
VRTDLGRRAEGTKPAPNPADPLYFETATTLPVDFHSFRRAFASALAEAGVNVQQARHLFGHTSPLVQQRYVMGTRPCARSPTPPYRASRLERSERPCRGPESSRAVTFQNGAFRQPLGFEWAMTDLNCQPTD